MLSIKIKSLRGKFFHNRKKVVRRNLIFRYYRYADRAYRHHPRGLIIYGPVTVSSILGSNNATLLWGSKDNSNFSKLDADDSIRNTYLVGGSQESLTANSTNNTVIPRCPLVSPHLSKLYKHRLTFSRLSMSNVTVKILDFTIFKKFKMVEN